MFAKSSLGSFSSIFLGLILLFGAAANTAYCTVDKWPVAALMSPEVRRDYYLQVQLRIFGESQTGDKPDPVDIRATTQETIGMYAYIHNYHGWVHEEFLKWIGNAENIQKCQTPRC